jgi:Cu(I)/Ag(I) efflux system membrane fusion protein
VSPKSEAPLVIPASAPLITGTRAVVYVRDAEAKRPTFEGREIVLGPRAGDYYVVRAGLKEGERVVVNGSFKIDSALQIEARPSMMSPAGGASGGGHQHGAKHASSSVLELAAPEAFRAQLNAVLVEYLKVQEALSGDSAKEAAAAAAALAQKLSTVDMKLLEGEAHVAWMGDLKALSAGVKHLARAGEIKKQREVFATLSEAMAAAVRRFHPAAGEVFVMKCPMAFGGRGARWLQNDKAVRNPYFGAAMLKCGEVIANIGKAGKSPAKSQSTCPVMGGKINRKLFADHGGKRVYFCCPGCKPEFRKDPERYLKKLRDAGVKLEDAPVPAPGKPEGRHGH